MNAALMLLLMRQGTGVTPDPTITPVDRYTVFTGQIRGRSFDSQVRGLAFSAQQGRTPTFSNWRDK